MTATPSYRDGAQDSGNKEMPRSVKGFEELQVHSLAWSFDGKKLAYATGPVAQEIVLLDRLN